MIRVYLPFIFFICIIGICVGFTYGIYNVFEFQNQTLNTVFWTFFHFSIVSIMCYSGYDTANKFIYKEDVAYKPGIKDKLIVYIMFPVIFAGFISMFFMESIYALAIFIIILFCEWIGVFISMYKYKKMPHAERQKRYLEIKRNSKKTF
jgi:hypothetical protein